MAWEVVGGVFVSDSLETLLVRMTSLEIDSFKENKLKEGLVKEMENKLLSANEVVNDAEEKQIRNPAVRAWLHELQGAVYDAEDLVQEINTEALRCKIEAEYKRSSHQRVSEILYLLRKRSNQTQKNLRFRKSRSIRSLKKQEEIKRREAEDLLGKIEREYGLSSTHKVRNPLPKDDEEKKIRNLDMGETFRVLEERFDCTEKIQGLKEAIFEIQGEHGSSSSSHDQVLNPLPKDDEEKKIRNLDMGETFRVLEERFDCTEKIQGLKEAIFEIQGEHGSSSSSHDQVLNPLPKDDEEKKIRNLDMCETVIVVEERFDGTEEIQGLKQAICEIQGEHGSSSSSHDQVLNPIPPADTCFIQRIESKMNEILDTLKSILVGKVDLGLKESVVVQTVSSSHRLPAPPATSSSSCVAEEEYGVYGRNDDKEAIIESLLPGNDSGPRVSVVPIVGRGGIGKTTLAQLVYNDERVQKCFDIKAWVSVSYEVGIYKTTKKLANAFKVTELKKFDIHLDVLQNRLKEALIGKKFLLVLDGYWNVDGKLWKELLKKSLEGEVFGSKIIVTTRYESVATMMRDSNPSDQFQTIPSYQLQTISDENCWRLFVNHAFNNVDPSTHPKLDKIGRRIVEKCRGLPLIVKLLGSVLRYQLSLEEWQNVLTSDMWELSAEKNNIPPALWLSYHSLPSHLKRCFAYCSVFPKNYHFDKEDLIKLWMAEDLLKPDKKKMIEEVGEDYFHDLLSRSLFQKSTSLFGSNCYTMHDLLHELAASVAVNFSLSFDDIDTDKLLISKVRHLSHSKKQINDLEKYDGLSKTKCLRTLLFPSECDYNIENQLQYKLAVKLLPTFTCLRVLSFPGCLERKLFDSIGNLKLLRYLNLSQLEIEEIPDTVCTLYNLQTLILSGCTKLKRLPTDMGKLINLRHLDISFTSLEMMPFDLGSMKDLQTLTDLQTLRNLQNLHGNLRLSGLEEVWNVTDVNLKKKKYLTGLDFCFDSGGSSNTKVLEGLEPHTSLKILRIKYYGGEKFPKWVGNPAFCNLEEISLEGCRKCSMLPPLGQLPFLKKLIIEGFDRLVKIGTQFCYGDCSVTTRPFRSVEYLRIYDMDNWEEWSLIEGDGGDAVFPNLKQLHLRYCPKLTAYICLPNTIEEVVIFHCKGLQLSGMQQQNCYGNLRHLQIEESCDFMNSIALDNFPMLEELRLNCVENVESLTYAQQSHCPASLSLTLIELRQCPKLRSLPKHMNTLLPALKTLYLSECPELELFPECPLPSQSISWRGDTDDITNIQQEVFDRLQPLTELQKLHIVFWVQQKLHIQLYEAKIFPNWGGHGSFSCLVKVDLVYCKSCYCLPSLGQLPFLKKLHIEGFDRVERIGDEFYSTDSLSSSKPFKSLESLTFSHMSQWKEWSLMKNGVFSDLKQLTLDNCRKLKGTCFPSYLPSLQSLLISGCQKQVVASLSTDGLPLLSFFKIGYCTELESFPIRALPANVDTVKIMGCKELVSLSEDGWPSNLKSLEISYCGKLFGNSLWWNLRTLTSLTSLQIIKIDEVVDSFPEEWQLPTTLKSLTLRHFRNLKSLNGKALQHHTSLKELKIEFCHLLYYLPEEGLPVSLSELEIFGCGFLNGRCQKERGEDWPKISHIPHIRIDCKDI